MTDEQRVEVIADDKVEVEQIVSVEPVAEAPEPESEAVVEQVAQAFHELAPKAKASKADQIVRSAKIVLAMEGRPHMGGL